MANITTLKFTITISEKDAPLYEIVQADLSKFKICITQKNDKEIWLANELLFEENEKKLGELIENNFEVSFDIDIDTITDIFNTYFMWGIYQRDDINQKDVLLSVSKEMYGITQQNGQYVLIPTNIKSEVQQEAEHSLKNLLNYTLQLTINELIDEHPVLTILNRKIDIQNNQNIIINQDNDSQEITFEMPRLYDGIDLTTKNLYVYFITPDGASHKEKLVIEEVSNSLIFYATWVVKLPATVKSGILTFAIIAEGKELDDYFWQTFPATLTINQGIFTDTRTTEDFQTTTEDSKYKMLLEKLEVLEKNSNKGILLWQFYDNGGIV